MKAYGDLTLDNDIEFCRLLRDADEDPVMYDVQDQFLDRFYYDPSVASATTIGIIDRTTDAV